jgi:hypothetical protein
MGNFLVFERGCERASMPKSRFIHGTSFEGFFMLERIFGLEKRWDFGCRCKLIFVRVFEGSEAF